MSIPQKIAGEPVSSDQATYLDGFFAGVKNRGLSFADAEPDAGPAPKAKKEKLTAEEKIKNELNPFDALPVLYKRARKNEAPEKEDIFRFKFNGLFWLGPVHEGYMTRLRMPGGIVNSAQFRELASIADDIAWGYLQLTTRNNVQLRVIAPKDTPELIRRIQDCGLHTKGSGADNLRNFTATPTSGYDKNELLDVMPLIKDLAHYIINQPEFYNLPRKFNISYDNGAPIRVAEDTNDIGLQAFKLKAPPEGHPLHGKVDEGVHFRILLGGVSGHQELAKDCGAICSPETATETVAAMTRVFIRNGNRSPTAANPASSTCSRTGASTSSSKSPTSFSTTRSCDSTSTIRSSPISSSLTKSRIILTRISALTSRNRTASACSGSTSRLAFSSPTKLAPLLMSPRSLATVNFA